MLDNANISSALVHQKDHIIILINNEEYEKALWTLCFVKEVWESLNYGYKTKELFQRLKDSVNLKVRESQHHKTLKKFSDLLSKIISAKEFS